MAREEQGLTLRDLDDDPTTGPSPSSRSLCLLTYHFPPLATAASHRLLSFAKHLPEFGWRPVVITVGAGAGPREDENPLPEFGPDVAVYRVRPVLAAYPSTLRRRSRRETSTPRARVAWRLANLAHNLLVALPDAHVLWCLAAARDTARLMRRMGIQCVVTSSPPHSLLLAGALTKRLTGGSWIADLRDPWPSLLRPSRAHLLQRLVGALAERVCAQRADAVLATTEPLAEALAATSKLSRDRVFVLQNGYDPERIENARRQSRPLTPKEPLTVVHAGSLYGGIRRPEPLLEAMANIRERGGPSVRLVLLGTRWGSIPDAARDRCDDLGLRGAVECPGFVSHDEALRRMASADVLLLLQGERFRLQIPSKAYEYLALGRPVLTLGDGGATPALIRSVPQGTVLPDDDIGAIAQYLIERSARADPLLDQRMIAEQVPTRREVVAQLAEVAERVTHRN